MRQINIIFLCLAFVAEIIGTIGGFGSSVFFVPISSIFFDFYSVLGITSVFHVFSNMSKILLFKKGIDRKLIINIGVPSIIFVILGGLLSKIVHHNNLEIALGIFLILLSLLFLIKKDIIILPTTINAITGGTLSGFAAGLLGTGGAIRGLTMAAFNLEKSVFIATSAVIDFGIDLTRTLVYWNNGYIGMDELIYVPFLMVVGFFGSLLGKKILAYIPQRRFKFIALMLILVIGIITILRLILES